MNQQAMVETLRGPVSADALGRVLIHEHVFIMDVEYSCNYRPDAFSDDTIATAAGRLNALKATGIDTIVDLTVLGIGRHVPNFVRLAPLTDINILVSTWIYTFDERPRRACRLMRSRPERPATGPL